MNKTHINENVFNDFYEIIIDLVIKNSLIIIWNVNIFNIRIHVYTEKGTYI